MKQIIIFTETDFDIRCGGLVVQYEFAKILNNLKYDVKIISPKNVINNIYNNFSLTKTIDVDNTIVIYGEGIKGNPLHAKYIIRWILAPLGLCCSDNIYKTWGPNDIVYYFNSENKFSTEPEKVGKEYKLLNVLYINSLAQNNNFGERKGYCHTFRKSRYHKNLQLVHPPNSFEIVGDLSQKQLIMYFNKFKFFISYDPLTFLSVIAVLCGCISIVKKVDGMSKDEWLQNTACSEYIKETGVNTLYGIAYGAEDVNNAMNTLHLAKKQWENITNFMINKYVKSFINDMEDYNNLINTVKNIYK